jgi:hypothetical protein
MLAVLPPPTEPALVATLRAHLADDRRFAVHYDLRGRVVSYTYDGQPIGSPIRIELVDHAYVAHMGETLPLVVAVAARLGAGFAAYPMAPEYGPGVIVYPAGVRPGSVPAAVFPAWMARALVGGGR